MGIRVQDPQMIEVRDDRTETYLRNIRENLHPRIQMVVIIFPTSRDDRYAAVKKLCCVESPVPSQVRIAVHYAIAVFGQYITVQGMCICMYYRLHVLSISLILLII